LNTNPHQRRPRSHRVLPLGKHDQPEQRHAFKSVPESLASSENDRHEGEVHVVDEVGGEELADRGRSATDADVEPARGVAGDGERSAWSPIRSQSAPRSSVMHLTFTLR